MLSKSVVQQCQKDKFIAVNDEILEFDYLLVASGSPLRQLSTQPSKSDDIFDLDNFMVTPGSELLSRRLNANEPGDKIISVIGGGATGIQFLFEEKHAVCGRGAEATSPLIEKWPIRKKTWNLYRYWLTSALASGGRSLIIFVYGLRV